METGKSIALRLILLALTAQGGCGGSPALYEPEEAEGPVGDFNGAWVDSGGLVKYAVKQAGGRATVRLVDGRRGEVNGEVVGRVLTIKGPTTHFTWTLTLSADGRFALRRQVFGGTMLKELLVRLNVIDTSSHHPRTAKDLLLRGGLIVSLPVGGDGKACFIPDNPSGRVMDHQSLLPAEEIRFCEALLTPQMLPDKYPCKNQIVSIDEPRSALSVTFWFPSELHDRVRSTRLAEPVFKEQPQKFCGAPCWWIVTSAWGDATKPTAKGKAAPLEPDELVAECYRLDPTHLDPMVSEFPVPQSSTPIATRDAEGRWRSDWVILPGSDPLVRARALIEDGRPVRLETAEETAPPLEEMLVARELSAALARWRNAVLIQVKNSSVPKMLREARAPELPALVNRLEKLALDLNHEAELTNDRAQKAMAADAKKAEQERELAVAYRQRIEILKPIIAAIKEEAANRDK